VLSIKVIDVESASIDNQKTKVLNAGDDILDFIEPLTLSAVGEISAEERAALAEQKRREQEALAEQKRREQAAAQLQAQREQATLAEQKRREQEAAQRAEAAAQLQAQREQEALDKAKQKQERDQEVQADYNAGSRTMRDNTRDVQFSVNGLASSGMYLHGVGANVAIGYRFNPYIFLGAGAGGNYYKSGDVDYTEYELSGVAIPVFVNFRWNMAKTMFSPYLELSVGGCFDSYSYSYSSNQGNYDYSEFVLYYSAIFGFDIKFNDRFSINIGGGYCNVYPKDFVFRIGITTTFNRYVYQK
jgi:hypothetical protein